MSLNPKKKNLDSDCQPLVEQYQKLRSRLIEKLYDTYAPAFYGYILKTVKGEEDAQEILKCSFIKIASDLSRFQASEKSLFAWMLSIVILEIRARSHHSKRSFTARLKKHAKIFLGFISDI